MRSFLNAVSMENVTETKYFVVHFSQRKTERCVHGKHQKMPFVSVVEISIQFVMIISYYAHLKKINFEHDLECVGCYLSIKKIQKQSK